MTSPPPVQLEVEVGDESMEDDASDMIPADRFALPSRGEAVVELWRSKMEEGVLAPAHFLDHWRVNVPSIYSPQPNTTCLDYSFDEDLAADLLIQPLEQFVWGNSDGSQPPLPRRSILCGRVFKQGDPAYSCRECGMDNTCVLCVECFKVSAHRHHKYKMGQSSGGGCCDCGDTEAWKRDPFCELHAASEDDKQEEATIKPDVVERMKIVASVTLSYCLRLLTHDHAPGLPNDLRLKDAERDLLQILDQPDCYCTVLYNDETHTFDQVITTLVRVTKCSQRESLELVSLIDREGRALVKCNSFQVCDKLKTDIEIVALSLYEYHPVAPPGANIDELIVEAMIINMLPALRNESLKFTSRHGPSLKVLVMHAHVIAHQTFAMKLLNWLQNFVTQEPSLRLAVSQVALGEEVWGASTSVGGGGGVACGVMQNDSRMWKAARTAWHRLLIATTLMDYSTKKAMAILFTKNYGSILKDFIKDDHDHSFSISSLSVQLYTTPTLAHHLIAKHDALFVVMNTFISECNRRCNQQTGRLEFDRSNIPVAFKRAQFILYDVKYLLSSVPTSFDDDLRKGFMHGMSLLLNLLVMMQGMDSVVRQVGQHMEYEPEWESAFNLHVKLAHSITLSLEWCAAEKTLATALFRMALRKFSETYTPSPKVYYELGNQSASVIPYDVSTKPVSIHRPLSRYIAGLHLLLHDHGLSYHSKEFDRQDKPKPTPVELIEPILQTMAMIGQVHAGMWRRNGFALINQLYFYQNVKCRAEMLDRDIVMLQVGASLIESNEFIIHALNKFKLLDWAKPDFERTLGDDSVRQSIPMVEEFLGLLITIYGARYVPGVGEVTNEDRTMKEIIQMLCIKPMPHSELNRCLPEDQLHETGLEAVIHKVADFIKPTSGNNRGVYKLKPHLYDEYDTFFYHYTREELSRSEEEQRNRRKAAGLPECCPPPMLPKLAPPFRLIANLLQCDAVHHVLKTVFERALDLRARTFSETQVHKALHLIGYALRDEESGHYEFVQFAEGAARTGLVALLQQLAASPRLEAHRELARWVYQKIRSLLGQNDEHIGDGENMETDQEEKPTNTETAEAEKSRRAKLAAERRAKLMAQMQTQMNNFISKNATLFEETTTEVTAEEQELRPLYRGAALGVWGGGVPEPTRTCIMCQEEARVQLKGPPVVLVAYVQDSTVLNRMARGPRGAVPGAGPGPGRHAWLPPGLGLQTHVSSCGHLLHADCFTNYIDNVQDKEHRRPYRGRQPAAFDVERNEYLCPLCERLCNAALPILPAPPVPTKPVPPLSEELYIESVNLILKLKHEITSRIVHICTEYCDDRLCRARARSVGPTSADMAEDELADNTEIYISTHSENLLKEEFLDHFLVEIHPYRDNCRGLILSFVEKIPVSDYGGLAASAALYRSTSYTIMSTNAVLQAENRPLLGDLPARYRETLQALIRMSAALPAVWEPPKHLSHHALSSLNTLERSSPLTHEPFSTLVSLVLSAPCLFCKVGGPARPTNLAKAFTRQCFRATLARALLVTDVSTCKSQPMEGQEEFKDADLENLLPFMKELRNGVLEDNLNPTEVWHLIKDQCHTFLRCCCLFYHFLSDISAPEELTVVGGDTWEVMCGYLDMPSTYKELVDTPTAKKKISNWILMSTEWFSGEIPACVVVEPKEPPNLISLPEDFSELMNLVSEFSCPNSDREDSKKPTMCLVCGQILCSQSYCCQDDIRKWNRFGELQRVGAVVAHCSRCGGGAGVFLRVRDCELLLLAAPARGAKMPAPYLDSYGETDQGLRRGNPLQLCPTRYSEVRMLWLSHGLHERIARSLDTNILATTAWQNL